jgi:serine/threonine protein kinase
MQSPELPAGLSPRYEFIRMIANQPFCDVVEAKDRIIGRRVAVKVTYWERFRNLNLSVEEMRERFIREMRAAASLAQYGAVQIFECSYDQFCGWGVMNFLEGGTLAEELREARGGLVVTRAVSIVQHILRIVHAAHLKGVVHRDLKPSNIMFEDENREHLVVVDFGVAWIAGSDLTLDGQLVGTPSYMAPEQVRGEKVDHRVDVWAAGIILYELITGSKPFGGRIAEHLLYDAILSHDFVDVSRSKGREFAWIDPIVRRALSKDRTRRFPTALAFSAALEAALPKIDDNDTTRVVRPRWKASSRGLARQSTAYVKFMLKEKISTLDTLFRRTGSLVGTLTAKLEILSQHLLRKASDIYSYVSRGFGKATFTRMLESLKFCLLLLACQTIPTLVFAMLQALACSRLYVSPVTGRLTCDFSSGFQEIILLFSLLFPLLGYLLVFLTLAARLWEIGLPVLLSVTVVIFYWITASLFWPDQEESFTSIIQLKFDWGIGASLFLLFCFGTIPIKRSIRDRI